MKLRLLILLTTALCGLCTAAAQPAPEKTTPREGIFTFGPGTTISADRELAPLAEYAAEYLGCGVRNGMAGEGSVVLTLDAPDGEPSEAYTLDIAPDHIQIGSSTCGGVFNGLQQLFRLLPPEVYARRGIAPGTGIACVRIEDKPRFGYRGMMLDVARTWIGMDEVKRYIDLFSYHNINKLHLHLSDDEGWRIEILSHPELTEIGGFRGGDSPVRPVYGKWSEKYGGYFKQSEMRELIRYAALRNIEIIPEIDLPGHSRNIASVHPEIRCNYPPDTVSTNGYDYRSAWCVAREENYALLGDILGELCELFPSEYIHVGGDEVDMSQWERCPDCRALMKREGMTDPHRLEDLFMERMAAILRSHGKRPAVWNEAVRTGAFARECRVHGWESVKACLDATAKGYRTVVMPGQYFYFDMRQSPREDGHDWAAIFDARKVYGFGFTEFSPEQMRNVEGLQGAFFSEAYVSHEPEKPDYLDYMLFPRVCALARIAWSGNAEGWDAYYEELKGKHYDRMAAMGIRFRLFPPKVGYGDGRVHRFGGRRLRDLLPYGRLSGRTPLHGSGPHRETASLPLLFALRHRPQPLRGRQVPLADHYARRGDHDLDGREREVPLCQRRELQGPFAYAPRLPAAGLDTLHVQRAGEVPRNVFADGKPPAAEDDRDDGLRRSVVRRRDVRAGGRVGDGKHHAAPRASGEGRADRLDVRRQRHALRHNPAAAGETGAVSVSSGLRF